MLKKNSLSHGLNSRSKCDDAIIVSGLARSGTSIVSKIIHSFKDIEFSYEPPLLFSLFSIINEIEEAVWRLLYETYLYEEILIDSLCGRALNCNLKDSSSIYFVKDKDLIAQRLSRSISKTEAESLAKIKSIAYKIPDVAPFLSSFQKYYPGSRVVLTKREVSQVFASLKRKRWFHDDNLTSNFCILFPSKRVNNLLVPFWVSEYDIDYWIKSDENHRIAYYYIQMTKSLISLDNIIKVDYDELVVDPNFVVNIIAKKLGVEFGNKTLDIVKSISRKSSIKNESILNSLNASTLEEVLFYAKLT